MKLKLERPLICIDLETTSKEVFEARICSLAIIKENPDGTIEKKYRLINPTIPISDGAILIHGITNDMVAKEKTFKNISKGLFEFMSGCDFVTYNGNNFDIPILAEEFLRCGINFPEPNTRLLDAFSIFLKESPRTLVAAYKTYCDKDLDDAHNAEADTNATYEVFKKQLEIHESLQGKTIDEIHDYCNPTKRADLSGKIIVDENGCYLYNFGKNQGKKVQDDLSYASWILSSNTFTLNTKNVLTKILKEIQDAK
jgi:DNA polymerase III subunit epsilon